MGAQSVDLVYELQGELNWDKDFASAACKEYLRWLELRAKAGDFQSCKLPPSRVVAMVWNLHRQWTMDYQNTCTALGGFIHHYPPVMRLSFSREQGYAVTFQTYKSHFKEEPPASYWEPPICQTRPNMGPPGLLTQTPEGSKDEENLLTASAVRSTGTAQEDRFKKDDGAGRGQKTSGFSRPRRKSVSNSRQDKNAFNKKGVGPSGEGSSDLTGDRAVFGAAAEPLSLTQGMMIGNEIESTQRNDLLRNGDSREAGLKDSSEKPTTTKKSLRGARKVQEGYVLRPLGRGEKRRRGRPSLSEYIPISELSDGQENEREPGLASDEKAIPEKSPDEASTPRSGSMPTAAGKSRKGGNSNAQARTIAPRPARKANNNRPYSSEASRQDQLLPKRTKNRDIGNNPNDDESKGVARNSKPHATGSMRIGRDGYPLRRPRGRPRKDGSWPIPRAKRQQTSLPVSGRITESAMQSASQRVEFPPTKHDGYLATNLVSDAAIEQGDVSMQSLEADVGTQMLETGDPDSNAGQVDGAVPGREHESVL